jgi:DNA-binding transcriptional LysR family regulator
MTISLTDFAAIRAFVAVARELSFARAAEALGVSPSALSQAVQGLEDRLGETLLNRTTRSMSLTKAGEALFQRMEPLIASMTDGLEEARNAGREIQGTVRVHAFRIAAKLYLAPILARFRQTYPRVGMDITLDDAVIDPVAAGYDAAIRLGEVIEQDMVAIRLGGDMRQFVVAAPTYLRKHGTPATPAELMNHSCVLWRWPGQQSTYDWEFAEGEHWFRVRPRGPIIVNDREFAIQAAVNGVGITIASEPHVGEHIAKDRLVSLLEKWCPRYPGFYLCYPQRRTVSRGLRALIDMLKASHHGAPPLKRAARRDTTRREK